MSNNLSNFGCNSDVNGPNTQSANICNRRWLMWLMHDDYLMCQYHVYTYSVSGPGHILYAHIFVFCLPTPPFHYFCAGFFLSLSHHSSFTSCSYVVHQCKSLMDMEYIFTMCLTVWKIGNECMKHELQCYWIYRIIIRMGLRIWQQSRWHDKRSTLHKEDRRKMKRKTKRPASNL